jgi:hypothetical protein
MKNVGASNKYGIHFLGKLITPYEKEGIEKIPSF